MMTDKNLESGDLRSTSYADRYFQQKPSSIPGLRMFENSSPINFNQSTPTSDESNSPTELNIYKRLLDKPPLIKKVPVSIKDMLHEEGFPSARPSPEGCISMETSTPSSEGKRRTKTKEAQTMR